MNIEDAVVVVSQILGRIVCRQTTMLIQQQINIRRGGVIVTVSWEGTHQCAILTGSIL